MQARRGHPTLELELQTVVSCHMGAETRTWVLYKELQVLVIVGSTCLSLNSSVMMCPSIIE